MIGIIVFLLVITCIFLFVEIRNLRARIDWLDKELEELRKSQVAKAREGIGEAAHQETAQAAAATSASEEPEEKAPQEQTPVAAQASEPVAEKPEEAAVAKKAPLKVAAKKVPTKVAAKRPSPDKPLWNKPSHPPKPDFDLVGKLRSVGLWPPANQGGSAELLLMQWWMPRIGGLLGLLAIVFFGVYMARGTAPWVKFLEMIGASGGVFGAGLYLSRKYKVLGNVLTATGLAMVYVCSVCGYALPAVRIVHGPIGGALLQLGALVLNFGFGSWKKDRTILLLSLIFGYVSACFAGLEGMREFALVTSLAVFVAGILSHRRVGGQALVVVSAVGVHLPVLGILLQAFYKGTQVYPWPVSIYAFMGLSVSALPLCQWLLGCSGKSLLSERDGRLLAAINTTMALGLGYLVVSFIDDYSKVWFYGVMAPVFLAWSLIWLFSRRENYLFHLFWIKGSVLASLWFVNYFSDDLRWVSLGLQVLVLALSARRKQSWLMELLAGCTWFVSLGFFADGFRSSSPEHLIFWLRLAYLLVTNFAWIWMLGGNGKFKFLYRLLYAAPAFAMFVLWTVFFGTMHFLGLYDGPRLAVGAMVAGAFFFIPGIGRTWVIGLAGALFVMSHFVYWGDAGGGWELRVMALTTALAGWALVRADTGMGRWNRLVLPLFHALWLFSLWRFLDTFQGRMWYISFVPIMSLGLLFIGNRLIKGMADFAGFPLLLWLLEFPNRPAAQGSFSLFVILLLVLMCLPVFVEWVRKRFWLCRDYELGNILLHSIGMLLLAYWVPHQWNWFARIGFWLCLCLLGFGFWYWKDRWVSWALCIFGALASVVVMLEVYSKAQMGTPLTGLPWNWQVMTAGVAISTVLLVLGAVAHQWKHWRFHSGVQTALPWLFALGAYGVYVLTLAYPPMQLHTYYTPTLAVFSVVLILVGIFNRNRAYRFVAMGSFVVPLVRLFAVDIKETLFRIIAFAVLAFLSVGVAYLYNKFAGRIDEGKAEESVSTEE